MRPREVCTCCGRTLPDVTFDMGTDPPLFLRWCGADAIEVRLGGRSVQVSVAEIEAFLRNVRQVKGLEPW